MRTFLLLCLLILTGSNAFAQSGLAGLWKTVDDETGNESSLVRIVQKDGVYTGTIEKLLPPNDPKATCTRCTDERRNQPITGMTILRGIKADSKESIIYYGGDILDPDNGVVYHVRLTLLESGSQLEVLGYVGTPMLGRSQIWYRIE